MTNIKIELSALMQDQKNWVNHQFNEGFYMENGEERHYEYRDKSNPITIKFQINDVEHEVKIQTEWKDMGEKDGILEPKRYLWFEILDQDQNLSLENVNYLKNYIIEFLQRNFGTSTFDDENYPVEYGASRSFSYDSNKKWSFSFSVKTVISQKSSCVTPTQMLRHAIRERDEKIEAEEARKRAEEGAELARQKAEEERIRLFEEKMQKDWEEIEQFIDEIGDFNMPVLNGKAVKVIDYISTWKENSDPDPRVNWQKYEINLYSNNRFAFKASNLPFKNDEVIYLIVKKTPQGFGYFLPTEKGQQETILTVQEVKDLIIRWAVENGAMKPEASLVG